MATDTYADLERQSLPLISSYQADLTRIDRECISENPGVPFVHLTRELGTVLIFLWPADSEGYPAAGVFVPYLFGSADRNHILREKASLLSAADNDLTLLRLYFDGQQFRTVTREHARQIIADYTRDIERQWRPSQYQRRL
ncbi:hypothetical protein LCGC14_1893980 [marine sediment metagenome]|uniref:Uncharacterized protein n=1 Tax=marine sediment metagenome TaxID=412755 RepID=A0A0F9FYW1_9ZZZZ